MNQLLNKLFRISILLTGIFSYKNSVSQTLQIGADYGRAYFLYKHKDYGTGFINENSLNKSSIARVTLSKSFGKNFFYETGIGFALYQQYYSTRRFKGAYESAYPIIHMPLLFGYNAEKRISFKGSGGIILGMMPDQYTGEYVVRYRPDNLPVDSITRGEAKRDFASFFPLININAGLKYQLTPAWAAELKGSFGKGFIKITEYDIYYNNGSGSNDQRARQWGTGDFYSVTLGVRYSLKNKSKPKSD